MLIIANDRWTIYFQGWRPHWVRTWISGIETAVIHAKDPKDQVVELKTRLRYAGVRNCVTDPLKVAAQRRSNSKPGAKKSTEKNG